MKAYRSQQLQRIENPGDLVYVGGVPILPLASGSVSDGPCAIIKSEENFKDIVSESIEFFRLNALIKSRFDLHSPADNVLVYLTCWIQKLLSLAEKAESVEMLEASLVDASKGKIDFETTQQFSFNSAKEKEKCEKYLRQLRVETARRLARIIWDKDEGGISKWWNQYSSSNFLGKM